MSMRSSVKTRPRPWEVAVFTPSALGGHARYTQELLRALAEVGEARGIRPSLLTSRNLAPEHRDPVYPIHDVLPPLEHRSRYRSRLTWALSRVTHYPRRERGVARWAASRPGLALLHAQEHVPWLAPGLYRSLRRRGVAVVETVHNIHAHHHLNGLHRRFRDAAARASWRRCDALIVHTEGLREELAAFLGPGGPPIHVTPHAAWAVSKPSSPADPDAPLLFFGIARPNKGLHVLLRAMEHLPGRRLVVCGHFPSADYRDAMVAEAGRVAPGRVEITDRFVTDAEAEAAFEGCGLAVLPYTDFSAQSGVLHQAIAHGRPVVVSDAGALGESVRAWGNGLVVPPEDPRALAEAISEATRPDRHAALSEAGTRLREELSWTRTASLTIDVYESIVASDDS